MILNHLQLDKHAAETIANPPKLLAEMSGFVHGVRDFFYEEKKGKYFSYKDLFRGGAYIYARKTSLFKFESKSVWIRNQLIYISVFS